MKYLARKGFQCERPGPDTGATMPKSKVPQPQHGGLRGAAVPQGAGPRGPQGTLPPAGVQEPVLRTDWFGRTQAPKPFPGLSFPGHAASCTPLPSLSG